MFDLYLYVYFCRRNIVVCVLAHHLVLVQEARHLQWWLYFHSYRRCTGILRPRMLSWFSSAGCLLELAEFIAKAWRLWGSIATSELAIECRWRYSWFCRFWIVALEVKMLVCSEQCWSKVLMNLQTEAVGATSCCWLWAVARSTLDYSADWYGHQAETKDWIDHQSTSDL